MLNGTHYNVETLKGKGDPSPENKKMINGGIINLKNSSELRGKSDIWRRSPETTQNENLNKPNTEKEMNENNEAKSEADGRKVRPFYFCPHP